MTRYFVWEPSSMGPLGRIWHDIQADGSGKPQPTVGKPVALPEGDMRTIEELKEAYPHE